MCSLCVCVSVLSWDRFSGVRVLALPGAVSYAADHGVYLSDPQVLALSSAHVESFSDCRD